MLADRYKDWAKREKLTCTESVGRYGIILSIHADVFDALEKEAGIYRLIILSSSQQLSVEISVSKVLEKSDDVERVYTSATQARERFCEGTTQVRP